MYFGEPTIDPDEPAAEPRPRRDVDSELGSAWPVAALFGACSAAVGAAASWAIAPALGGSRPWGLLVWCAEHALWGTVLGTVIAAFLRLGARYDPLLLDGAHRRAAAARVVPACVALCLLALAAPAGADLVRWQRALFAAASAGLFGVAAARLLAGALAGSRRFEVLPRLDAARVAVLIALLTLPLAGGASGKDASSVQAAGLLGDAPGSLGAPASLVAAWHVMLGE